MSCSSCGSTTSCTCSNICNAVISSVPFYQQVGVCTEDHVQKVYQAQFFFSICPNSSWNVPLCGQTAVLNVPGLQGATVGSYMWHPTYGYFEITSVDSSRGQVGITNNCTEGNAAVGTQIPACTCFTVTVPPAEGEESSQVCVAVSFTAPDVDVPTDITLTSTTGLQQSDTIQIGTGFYFVDAIKPNNIITIVNQGDGVVPGTAVIAQDVNGNFLNCLSVIASNPCDGEPQISGKILGCSEDGLQLPIKVPANGYVLAGLDPDTNTARFVPMSLVTPQCTTLTTALAILAGDATYTIEVESSAGFATGNRIIVGDYVTRADITAVPDGTHLDITFVSVPGASDNVAVNSVVCAIGCCEFIADDLDDLNAIAVEQCVPQVVYQTYAAQVFVEPIVLDGDGVFNALIEANLGTFEPDENGAVCEYLISARLNVIAVVDFLPGLSDVSMLLSELDFELTGNAFPMTGRFVWTDYGSDGWDISGVVPGAVDAVQKQLLPPATNYPMMYHGGVVENFVISPGGTPLSTLLRYRCAVGENYVPTMVDSVTISVSGVITAWRIY